MPVNVLLAWLLVAAIPATIQAGSARMELAIAPGVIGEADYWPGAADKPAVLILHGFLQTREFATVYRLAESLAAEGFSVLTPSLTLGLSQRRQSMACEAVHTHTLEQDVAELHAWVAWLAERAGKAPVVVGHSTGGVQLAAMLEADTTAPIAQAIVIGVTGFGQIDGGVNIADLKSRAKVRLTRGDAELGTYPLGYCQAYVTTAEAFLSYISWDHDRLRAALTRSTVPVAVIFGEQDDRAQRTWLRSLQEDGVSVRGVPGASHFFDLAHEFDLLDEMVEAITEDRRG